MRIEIEDRGGAIRFWVRVQPRASRTESAGPYDGALRVRLAAAPVEGEANRALVRHLAKRLGVPRAAVRIVSGEGSRSKLVEVEGMGLEAAARILAEEGSGEG